MNTVSHDGRETAYRQRELDASDPTVLYVHGSGGDHSVWKHQLSADGPTRSAVAVDLSGHGSSDDIETDPGPETLSAYAADVGAVAERTNADILVGNSLGGAVVFEVLLSERYGPDAVVFAGSGAKLAVYKELRELLTEDYDGAIEFLHSDSRLFYDPREELLADSKAKMRATGQAVTRRDLLTCHVFDVRDRLDGITVPALALVGTQDGLTPPRYHEYLAAELPECELAVIDDGAHLAMLERPTEFNDAIESFCNRAM